MFTEPVRNAARIMLSKKPKTMGGIFESARAEGKDNGDAWEIVDAHYANLNNPDYRAAAGLPND